MARSIILFDLDGTLSDSQSQIVDAVTKIATENYSASEADFRQALIESMRAPHADFRASLWRALGRDPAQVPEEEQRQFQSLVSAAIADVTTLFPEVPAVLASLKQTGHTLIMSTNTPQEGVEQRVETAGIRDYFAFVLGVDHSMAGASKTEHPLVASQRLSMTPKDFASAAVFVRDAEGDMEMAKDAGLLGIGRLTGDNGAGLTAAGADHVIADLTELEPLLRELK